MRKQRQSLRAVILAAIGLLPIPALGQGGIGPLEQIQSHQTRITMSVQTSTLVFYLTYDPYSGSGLWRSDGTRTGTFPINMSGANPLLPPRLLGTHGDLVFLTRDDGILWRSDGTDAGTFPLVPGLGVGVGSDKYVPVPELGLVFFVGGGPHYELWATDGTVAGTRLVKDIDPELPSYPDSLVAFGGRLYFLADTSDGREVWRSDGTPEGTERFEAIPEQSFAVQALAHAGETLFAFLVHGEGMEVWRSDGTEAGTGRMLELPRMHYDRFVETGRRLFLIPRNIDTLIREVWAFDGVSGEAVRLLQGVPEVPDLRRIGDNVVFAHADDYGLEPWWSDGTVAGTRRAADLCPGPCDSSPQVIGSFGGRAVLSASDGTSGREPWMTNGTAAGTFRLGDLCPGECGTSLTQARESGGWLLLYDGTGLWASDGTRDGAARRIGTLQNIQGWHFLPGRVIVTVQAPILEAFGSLWTLPVTAPPSPPPPAGNWITSGELPGFRVKARITAGSAVQPVRQEPCIVDTICLSGAVRGRPEVFVRVVGPRPNGYLWPTLVRFTPSTVEVWIEQVKTGTIQYYLLEGVAPNSSELNGLVDRQGFQP